MEYEVNIIITMIGEFVYNIEYDCYGHGYYGDNTFWNGDYWVTIRGIYVSESEVLIIEEGLI